MFLHHLLFDLVLSQGGGRSGGADASSDNKSHLLRRVADVFGSTDPEEVAARFASLNARRIAAKEAATMSGEKIRVLREAQSQRSAKAEGGEESHEYERRASRLQTIDATLDNLTQRLTRLRTVRSREDTLRIEAASLEAAIRSLADLLSFLPAPPSAYEAGKDGGLQEAAEVSGSLICACTELEDLIGRLPVDVACGESSATCTENDSDTTSVTSFSDASSLA
eukprot:GHVU01171592.1.p2 GENE.GHVU01171592.1~~GHVU01171592.1.p2  ORF type:complete len:224 (+),score=46.38 GHVU01171592.1:794-1465(+)